MIIAKEKITGINVQFMPNEVVIGLSADEEKRLIALGVVKHVEDLPINHNPKNQSERKEVTWFKEVMESTTVKEKIEYAKNAEIEIGKSKTNKELMNILVDDAEKNGVDVQAFNENQLFSFAEKMDIETTDKEVKTIISEIEAGFENV